MKKVLTSLVFSLLTVTLWAQSKITFTDEKSGKTYTAENCQFLMTQVLEYRVGQDDIIHFYWCRTDTDGNIYQDENSYQGVVKKTQPGPALNTVKSLMDNKIGKGERSNNEFIIQVPNGDYNW
jgi:hypothetical protein